jgi:hypothetical protein
VRQGLALVAVEEDDVAGFGLSLAQLKAVLWRKLGDAVRKAA